MTAPSPSPEPVTQDTRPEPAASEPVTLAAGTDDPNESPWVLLLLLGAAVAGTVLYRRNTRSGDGVTAVAVSDSAPPTVAADWYPDPMGRYGHRYWDGARWTEQVATDGVQYEDPLA